MSERSLLRGAVLCLLLGVAAVGGSLAIPHRASASQETIRTDLRYRALVRECERVVRRPAALLLADMEQGYASQEAGDSPVRAATESDWRSRADAIDAEAWRLLGEARSNWFDTPSEPNFRTYMALVDGVCAADNLYMGTTQVPSFGFSRTMLPKDYLRLARLHEDMLDTNLRLLLAARWPGQAKDMFP